MLASASLEVAGSARAARAKPKSAKLQQRLLQQAGVVPKRGRGRPRKVREEDLLGQETAIVPAYSSVVRAPTSEPIPAAIVKVLAVAPTGEPSRQLVAITDLVLGSHPRRSVPASAEAAQLGEDPTRLKNKISARAALTYHVSRLHFAGVAGRICQQLRESRPSMKAVLACVGVAYDETPLPASCRSKGPGKFRGRRKAKASRPRAKPLVKQLCKIVQGELIVTLVVESDSQFFAFCVELPVPLRTVDSAAGETLFEYLSPLYGSIPYWSDISALFPIVDLTNCDRAAPNLRAEDALSYLRCGTMRLRIPCHVHMVSTVQGKAYDIAQSIISGCISVALALRQSGALESFREALRDELKSSVRVIVDGTPPGPDSPEVAFRKQVFEWTLVTQEEADTGIQRQLVLNHLLAGDWRGSAVDWYTSQGNEDVDNWASQVVAALVPSPIGIFPRGRWVSSDRVMREFVLLSSCHRLLPRVIRRWLDHAEAPVTGEAWTLADEAALQVVEFIRPELSGAAEPSVFFRNSTRHSAVTP